MSVSCYTDIVMAIHKKPLVIGNWKMNPLTRTEAVQLAKAIAQQTKKLSDVSIVIAPPTLYLGEISKVLARGHIALGVQHTHPGPIGAFTGEISPAQCAQYDVSYGICGHSERRARGETDNQINAEVLMLLKQKMRPVICVGERERDAQANFYSVIETQLTSALASVPTVRYKDVVIAYEPVWAIGTGATATPADVQEMRLFIIKVITKLAGRAAAGAVTILYGGSVTADTAKALFTESGVQGFLVGGASLKPTDFTKIIQSTLT